MKTQKTRRSIRVVTFLALLTSLIAVALVRYAAAEGEPASLTSAIRGGRWKPLILVFDWFCFVLNRTYCSSMLDDPRLTDQEPAAPFLNNHKSEPPPVTETEDQYQPSEDSA